MQIQIQRPSLPQRQIQKYSLNYISQLSPLDGVTCLMMSSISVKLKRSGFLSLCITLHFLDVVYATKYI
jgi:hypothetical protein